MNNIQKNFKNKAKCGLRLAQGTGDLGPFGKPIPSPVAVGSAGFMQTIPDALPTSMFAPQPSANPNQGPALYGAGGGSSPPISPTALSSGSTDLDTLGTPQGSAPQFSAAVDTMAEKAARAGLDPNAAYRPGGPGDPHASFSPGSSALRAGQASPQRQRRPTPDMITPYEPSRRMADGGILPTLRNRGAQIDAAVDSAVNPQAAPVAADPDAPDASGVRPSERAAARTTMSAAAPKKSSFTLRGLGKALGMAEGGIVRGKGGPTDDAVPMTVGGVDVRLSNKEAVLPAKTVQALGGPSAVEDLIETTNGKSPVRHGLRAGGEYANGAVETDTHWPNGQPKVAPTGETMRPAPTAQEVYAPVYNSDLASATGRNVKGLGGAAAWGVGGALSYPARATDVLKNTVSSALGQVRDNPNGDRDASLAFAAEGARAAKENFAPVTRLLRDATGLRDAAPPKAAAKGFDQVYDPLSNAAQDMVSDQPFDAGGAKTRNLYRSVSGTQGTDVLPDGLRAGPANSAAFNTPNNMAADTMGNFWQGKPGVQQQDGTGVASMRQKDGSYKNVALGKSEYTGADGKPTSNWADTQAFKDSEARNTRLAGLARSMERDRYGRDMGADIKDPRVIAAAQQNINRMDREDALASATENARMDRGLRQQQLGIQNKTADAQIRHADIAQQLLLAQRQAAAKAQGIENMQKIVAQAGYEGGDAKEYTDFINLNHASDLAGMPHDKQLAMEPILRAKFEAMRNNNRYSTNGVRTIKNLEKTGESTLDYEKDAALDPTSIGADKLLWFGDGEDGRGLGRANIFLRNNMPKGLKPLFGVGTDAVDVFGGEGNVGGQRVMRKDVPGMRGPLLKTDMANLREKELQKNSR